MWSEVGEQPFFGTESIEEVVENVAKVRENLKTAQGRQKSYADKRRRDISFEVGDHVYLKVSPLCGSKRFHVRGKLAPRFIALYPIIARVGELAYKLQLPEELAGVHPVFNVSQLTRRSSAARDRRYARNPRVRGVSHQDSGQSSQGNSEDYNTLLQGSVEQSRRTRSYVGEGR